jgi:translation initiation factor IF-2
MAKGYSKPKNDKRTSNFSRQKGFAHPPVKEKISGGVFTYYEPISVSALAEHLQRSVAEIIKFLFLQGQMVTINSVLDDELIGMVCLNFGFDFKKEKVVSEENFEDLEIVDDFQVVSGTSPGCYDYGPCGSWQDDFARCHPENSSCGA